jgi:hypothetical protein
VPSLRPAADAWVIAGDKHPAAFAAQPACPPLALWGMSKVKYRRLHPALGNAKHMTEGRWVIGSAGQDRSSFVEDQTKSLGPGAPVGLEYAAHR